MEDALIRSLCNTASINSIYNSNHSLESLKIRSSRGRAHLRNLLHINSKGSSKSHVAIKKILIHFHDIDTKPLFEWNVEDDQQSLKSLPFIISWFRKVDRVMFTEEYISNSHYRLKARKLDAIFQYARAVPYLFVPATQNINGGDKK